MVNAMLAPGEWQSYDIVWPIRLQDHKDLPSVKYRSIWIREIKPAE
jgi:hypothetical protein